MIMIAYYARAPHCPQNGPWTGAPQALQKLRGGAGGGISQLRSGAAAGISSADGADGTGKPWSGPDSTVPSDAKPSQPPTTSPTPTPSTDTTVPNTWTSTVGGGAAAAFLFSHVTVNPGANRDGHNDDPGHNGADNFADVVVVVVVVAAAVLL